MLIHQSEEIAQDTEEFDLVVIGAGIAGLNALNSAAEYLPRSAKALLVDQKDQAGGMWNVAYDYVRLHQPHPMFTVGDMKWGWSKPRDYLAARDEVREPPAASLDRQECGNPLFSYGGGVRGDRCLPGSCRQDSAPPE